MIDIENIIFANIVNELREQFNPIFIYGEYVKAPADFPTVCIEEKSNADYYRTQDSNSENHASLMYEVNVYSNKQVGKKAQCKEIFKAVDEQFKEMGFTRILKEPVPNLENATIYRMIGRYTAVSSADGKIFRR